MEFEPESFEFRAVRLNQAYTTSLCVTNTFPTAVDFTLSPSSSRITISPSRVNLPSGQSIVVTIRLYLNHNSDLAEGTSNHEEAITIRSSFFVHTVKVSYILHGRDLGSRTNRSMSMSLRNSIASSEGDVSHQKVPEEVNRIKDLERQLSVKNKTIQQLESIVTELESKFPSIKEVVRNRVDQERMNFEEKSEKVQRN